MSTAAVKWGAGSATVRRREASQARRDPEARRDPDLVAGPQHRPIECAELEQIRERGCGITPPRALARVEHALFVLTLTTVAYLWVAQAVGLS